MLSGSGIISQGLIADDDMECEVERLHNDEESDDDDCDVVLLFM